MTQQYPRLSTFRFAAGFGVATLVVMMLLFAPVEFSMFGMRGYGMMMGGSGMGLGTALLACLWAIFVGAVAGAVAAGVYNSLLPSTTATETSQPPRPS